MQFIICNCLYPVNYAVLDSVVVVHQRHKFVPFVHQSEQSEKEKLFSPFSTSCTTEKDSDHIQQ